MNKKQLVESGIRKIFKKYLRESNSELESFIRANKSKIELEYEMNGTIDFIKSKFPTVSDDEIEQSLNRIIGI